MDRATLRYVRHAFLVAAGLTAAAAWPAHAWGGGAGLGALGLAAAICLVGAAVAHVAASALMRLHADPAAGPQAVQLGVAVRLFLTLALSAPVLFLKPVPDVQFALWLGLHYLGQLVLEVFVGLRESGQNHGPTGRGEAPQDASAAVDHKAPPAGEEASGAEPE